jgi:O-antigen/teichoic acid export membrane protein
MTLAGNVAARVAALASVFAATLLLAWDGGPAAVGVYALLHVLPGLVGTIASCGLAVAVPYFLAGPRGRDRRLPATLVAMAAGGGVVGGVLWAAASPLFAGPLFGELSPWLVATAGTAVLTRLVVTTAKACSQGGGDLPGANRVIVGEEVMFLPAYGVMSAAGLEGGAAVIFALLAADAATAVPAWSRLVRRGFFAGAGRPSRRLARDVAAYGLRAQVGGLIAQLNLRLDFVILTALTGPAVLGVYAVASKFAELLRVVTMALTYVLYPAYARAGRARAAAGARRAIPRAGLLTAGAAVVLWLGAGAMIPAVYGAAFHDAVIPARIILLGLALEGVAAVITAFLYGAGRPGLNSWAMAAGLAVTVALDLVLIPLYGEIGAAIASAAAYTTASLALLWMFSRVGRAGPASAIRTASFSRVEAR